MTAQRTVTLFLLGIVSSAAFVSRQPQPARTGLAALTERQQQFWEDVETGLDDIESYYEKKGLDIDRLRQFGRRYVHIVLYCSLHCYFSQVSPCRPSFYFAVPVEK